MDSNVIATGFIILTASDAPGAGDDLTINSGVTVQSTGSSVTLNAGDDLIMLGTAQVIAATNVTMDANFGAADAIGGINLADGSSVDAQGTIDVDALEDITLGLLTTAGDVAVDSASGSILDTSDTGGSDIDAATAILNSATGVGMGANPLETMLDNLEADGGSSGVWVANTGDLEIGGISG